MIGVWNITLKSFIKSSDLLKLLNKGHIWYTLYSEVSPFRDKSSILRGVLYLEAPLSLTFRFTLFRVTMRSLIASHSNFTPLPPPFLPTA